MLCSAKIQSHPENTVGLLTTAGKSAKILISATHDLGKVFACMHDVKLEGAADIVAGIQKAQLALKHRQNTNQRQRVVVFVSSPIAADEETLVNLGKKLKKNSVAVDVVHVGDDTDGRNIAKLDAFIAAVNSSENSRVLHVPAGGLVLADALMSSDIYAERDTGDGAGAGPSGTGGATSEGFEFGVDPAVDPELALALRLSMEDERARQAAANPGGEAADTVASEGAVVGESPASAPGLGGEPNSGYGEYDDDADLYGTGTAENMDVYDGGDEDEDALLRQTIALSQAEGGASTSAPGTAGDAVVDEVVDEDMDEEMRRAIEMSKADFDEDTKKIDEK
jgi:26S proteasome regulatory subunit N10